mmetsp:Transcript_15628/g.17216  ORF Transcript_15628/g.17216 Transcript_15628/m.17216 type:complete len:85 (-) Transcript_15628:291-545(-)
MCGMFRSKMGESTLVPNVPQLSIYLDGMSLPAHGNTNAAQEQDVTIHATTLRNFTRCRCVDRSSVTDSGDILDSRVDGPTTQLE